MMRKNGLVNPWFYSVDDDLIKLEKMCECYNRCILSGCDLKKLDMVNNMRDLTNMAICCRSLISGSLVDTEKVYESNSRGGIVKLATRPKGNLIAQNEKNIKVCKITRLYLFV